MISSILVLLTLWLLASSIILRSASSMLILLLLLFYLRRCLQVLILILVTIILKQNAFIQILKSQSNISLMRGLKIIIYDWSWKILTNDVYSWFFLSGLRSVKFLTVILCEIVIYKRILVLGSWLITVHLTWACLIIRNISLEIHLLIHVHKWIFVIIRLRLYKCLTISTGGGSRIARYYFLSILSSILQMHLLIKSLIQFWRIKIILFLRILRSIIRCFFFFYLFGYQSNVVN